MSTVLSSLCRANLGILSQKVALMDALVSRHGPEKARALYKLPCQIVGGSSIGQHIRHSMDHMELAALVASTCQKEGNDSDTDLHYDLRVRGGTLEHDIDLARQRIESVEGIFQELNSDNGRLATHSVKAKFFLTADENDEFALPSTIARELGFAAHHAIHHMALIRVIALSTAELDADNLPTDFGRAPSTVKHDREVVL